MKREKRKAIWIGYVGRIAAEKGIEYLVQSIKRLNFLPKIKLVFAGPNPEKVVGEKKYWNKIKKQLEDLKIKYLFFRDLSDKKLGAFYDAVDVLVLPSTNRTEAFGMVQVEAMLWGTPVVATNLPGVRVPIKLTKMGLLVEPKNSKQLSEAILTIIKNRKKYSNEKLIKNAKKIFNPRKTYQFYDDLVNHIQPKYTAAV